MPFKKAEPKQARLKIGFYGPQGSGKTFTALLIAEGLARHEGKRVAFVDTERGTDFYAVAVKERKVHAEAFDFDAIYSRSLAEVTREVAALKPEEYGVIVIDSISHLWDAAIAAYTGKKTSKDTIPFAAWADIKRPYKRFIQWLVDSPFHVIICGRQKAVYENDGDQLRKVGEAMRAEGETEYEPHFTARFESQKNQNDTTKSTVYMVVEKDRTGMLAGQTIAFPNFKTFEPMLKLLGKEQAKSEDPDEVAAIDAGLIDEEKAKQAAKAAASQALRAQFAAEIATAQTPAELAAIKVKIGNVQKSKLFEEDVALLRQDFSARSNLLSPGSV